MKRARGDRLTGGTGDVNPQQLSFSVDMAAADTTIQKDIFLPIIPLSAVGKGEAQVLELLKMFVWMDDFPTAAAGGHRFDLLIGTKNFNSTIPVDEEADALVLCGCSGDFTHITSGQTSTQYPIVQDLTDGQGHGILVGVQTIYALLYSGSTGVALKARVKLLYRVKRIGTTELLGIIASQFQA